MSRIIATDLLAFSSQHVHINTCCQNPRHYASVLSTHCTESAIQGPLPVLQVDPKPGSTVRGSRLQLDFEGSMQGLLVFKDLAGTITLLSEPCGKHAEHKAQGKDSNQSVLPAPRAWKLGHIPASSRISRR